MFTQDQLAERNQRRVSWMVVPALVLLMIAALVVPALIEPSEHPPVESIFNDEDATATPTITPTPQSTPDNTDNTEPTQEAEQHTEKTVFCTMVNVGLCFGQAFTPGEVPDSNTS